MCTADIVSEKRFSYHFLEAVPYNSISNQRQRYTFSQEIALKKMDRLVNRKKAGSVTVYTTKKDNIR
ncbi:MAG: hypothetical protein SV686_09660 [Thermodesulfobacteriota bacterium]|nr:hypothetical protein [Thermodesulfobacteriota bacterium]